MKTCETCILREHAITILVRLVLVCFLLGDLSASAETSPARISAEADTFDLSSATWLLEDPDGQLKLTDVQSPAIASRFKPGSPSIGFTAAAYWLRFTLLNGAPTPATWWLDSGDRFMQEMDLFSPDANGVYQHQSASSARPFADRPIRTTTFVFPVLLQVGKPVEIFLRVRSTGFMPIALSPALWQPAAHQIAASTLNAKWMFYLGMAGALGLFNLLLFFFIRDRNYVFLVMLYVANVWWLSMSRFGSGLGYQYMWPDSPIFNQLAFVLSVIVVGYCSYLFQSRLMDLPRSMPKLDRLWERTILVALPFSVPPVLGSVLPSVIPVHLLQAAARTWYLIFVLALVWNGYAIYTLFRSGNRAARALAVAWSPGLLILFYVVPLSYLGIHINWAIPPMMLGSGLEMILMSLVLADRVNEAKEGKAKAQADMVALLQRSERELEAKVAQRTTELMQEQNRTKELLHNILPVELADELAATGSARPVRHESVSVLFTDLSGFTQAASTMPPDRMVAELNEIFAGFDDICDELGVEKIKTIGDAYMAAAGLPSPCSDHAQRCVAAGLRMVSLVAQRNQSAAFKWSLRVGIHSGPVVAGVVGKRKYAFDIWGDAVNIASRMESSGEVGRVNISAYTYDLVRNDFDCEYRGKVGAKGKGDIDMYFVKGSLHQRPL